MSGFRFGGIRRPLYALLAALAMWAASGPPASAATLKQFTVSISTPSGAVPVAGTTSVFNTAVITNVNGGLLDTVNLTAPANHEVTGIPTSSEGTALIVGTGPGNVLRLEDLGLSMGASATVSFQDSVACAAGTFHWAATGSGSTTNQGFQPTSASTGVTGNCSLAFVPPGPQDNRRSTNTTTGFFPMTTRDNDSSADPFQVEIRDGNGTRLSLSHFLSDGARITLAIQPPLPPFVSSANLVGMASANTTDSVASFSVGIDTSGIGYVLRADSAIGDIGSGYSNVGRTDVLSIWDSSNRCKSSGGCPDLSTGVAIGPGQGHARAEGLLHTAALGDSIAEAWNVEDLNSCPGYTFIDPDEQLTFESNPETTSYQIITVTYPKKARKAFTNNGEKPHGGVCFSSHIEFIQRDGTLTLTRDSFGFFTGLLPDQGQYGLTGQAAGPMDCAHFPQVLANRISGADWIIQYCAPPGDPKGHS